MAIPPRKIRQLPPALPADDMDVFPISQIDPQTGVATTRAMTRAQNNAEMIAVIAGARQDFVDMAEVEHDRLEAKIDSKADAPVAWNQVAGKPETFPPTQHTHPASEVTGLPATPTWSTLTGKPNTFPPSTHSHAISDVTGLQSALDAKTTGAAILGEVDVLDQAVVVLGLGVRSKDVTVPASWGMRTTDTLFVTAATSLPVGYAIDNAIPLTTTSIRVYFVGPALALLASNTFRVRVAAIGRTS